MYKRKYNNKSNNKQNNKKIKLSSNSYGLFGVFPVEIWYIIFEYYQLMIKIRKIKITKIREQMVEQSDNIRFKKFNYVNKYSYVDIQNIAMVNSSFYNYWYYKLFKIDLIQENSMKFILFRKNKLVNLKQIGDHLFKHYNIKSNLRFIHNSIKKEQYKITQKQYNIIKIHFEQTHTKTILQEKKLKKIKKKSFVIPEININKSDILSSILSSNNVNKQE